MIIMTTTIKESKKIDEYLDLPRELKNVADECDGESKCSWYA